MNRTTLINGVKIKLDEYTPSGVSLPLDTFIGPLLDESARDILKKGPLHLLNPTQIPITSGDPPATTILYEDDKAYIPVPSDFIRLYEIKFPLWKRSVIEAISKGNPEYRIQENEYLRAGYGRPVVAIVLTSVKGGAVTRYFECAKVEDPGSDSITPVALYVKSDLAENIADQFSDSLEWLATSKVLTSMGYLDKAAITLQQHQAAFNALIL